MASLPKFIEISANLPNDIISDIFTRLPIKSIAQFKCVSKSMYALLNNPKFIKQHLRVAILKNPNLILKLDSKLFSVDDEEWSKARRLQLPFVSSIDNVELSGSCNGLLCISDQQRNEDIFLYNPSIGVFNKLPLPDFNLPISEIEYFTTVGFGYHHEEDDYKVVRCVYCYDDPFSDIDSYQCEARVFSLNNNTWKKIENLPFHLSYKAAIWLGNEFLIWKATWGFCRTITFLIVAYNMIKEEFVEIPQPDISYPKEIQMDIGELGGLLSLFYHWKGDLVHVWSMMDYGAKESWTLLYVIQGPEIIDDYNMFLKPLTILKNGEILIEVGDRGGVVYDPKNGTSGIINIQGAPTQHSVTTNVGSLVSPFSSGAESA